ncbi:MAG: hypothetical protein ABI852_14500 [Gemmatimonadaceae bacterium]
MFLFGDAIRRGRHPLWDPAFFDGIGLIWGLGIGALFAARVFTASPAKAILFGIAVTVAGIGVVGGTATVRRYRALPQEPQISGRRVELEFELRLPADRKVAGELPVSVELDPTGRGGRGGTEVTLVREAARVIEGRIVMAGKVRIKNAVADHLLSVSDLGNYVNFRLPLPEIPTDADIVWTEWMAAMNAENFELRYRVRFDPER